MGASETKSEIIILLVGGTGDGKSSTGNTILRQPKFKSESSPNSKTKDFEIGNEVVAGRNIKVIDTPGIFDTSDESDIKEKLIKALVECAPGPPILTFVLKVGRYTSHEKEIEEKIWEYLKEYDFKHSMVLFTHGEQLEGQKIEDFVKKSQKLQELVEKCGGRCHVIDNKHWNERLWGYRSNRVQVRNLMETIDEMVKENSCYDNELIDSIEELIQKEIELLSDVNLSPEKKREKAKKTVFKELLIRFAGVTAGTLTGAFLGIAVPLACLVALVKGVKKESAAAFGNGEEKEVVAAAATEGAESESVSATAAAAAGGAAVVSAAVAAGVAVEAGVAAGVAGGAAAAAGATAVAGAVAVEAGVAATAAGGAAAAAAGATAGAVAVEAGVAAGGAAAAAGTIAVEGGVVAGAGIGAAAGAGIATGVIFGAAALAGGIGGGIAGYRAAEEADSVLDAIKKAARANYENAKTVVDKAEQLPSNIRNKFKKNSIEYKNI